MALRRVGCDDACGEGVGGNPVRLRCGPATVTGH